jgi:hypothetical protein
MTFVTESGLNYEDKVSGRKVKTYVETRTVPFSKREELFVRSQA